MTYEYLKSLKNSNLTLKLINSDNFAFALSFFDFVFNQKRFLSINASMIEEFLEDFLYDLNKTYSDIFPKSAKDYLSDWTNSGFLKKYYDSSGEIVYEITPYTKSALEFIEALDKSEFIGSRTKFNIIFELLEELEFETNLSDEERIKALKKQKDEIDEMIEKIKKKEYLKFDKSRVKEHYLQIVEQSRKLLYDFSQIEYNFRELNKDVASKILGANSTKDRLLGSIFDIEERIRQSDQGKSFFAFWQLLTNAQKSEQLTKMIENLYKNETILEFDKDKSLKNLKFDLLNNAQKISKTTNRLVEQLRRFLDDKVWLEHKKILELCKSIQKSAIEVKQNPPKQRVFMEIDGTKVPVDSVFEKRLFTIKEKSEFTHEINEQKETVDLSDFYNIFYVDEEKLKQNINYFLQIKTQVSLEEVVQKFPVKNGIAELISYLSLAKKDENSLIYEESITLEIEDENGYKKRVKMPKVVFVRE